MQDTPIGRRQRIAPGHLRARRARQHPHDDDGREQSASRRLDLEAGRTKRQQNASGREQEIRLPSSCLV
jgi:hypothetical protein